MNGIYAGIDIGSSAIRLVELKKEDSETLIINRLSAEHHNNPIAALKSLLESSDILRLSGIIVTGSLCGVTRFPQIPPKYARVKGFNYLHDTGNCVVISIGDKTNSILEIHDKHISSFHENSKCAQGSGNFLLNILSRFNIPKEELNSIDLNSYSPSKLSGRCPVLIKTNITHLHNTGESKESILAGLLDIICDNIIISYKPGSQITSALLTGGVSSVPRVRNNFLTFFRSKGINLLPDHNDNHFIDAIGAALSAIDKGPADINVNDCFITEESCPWETTSPLSLFVSKVKRAETRKPALPRQTSPWTVAGIDIGSTGSKLVILDYETERILHEDYIPTNGEPVHALKTLLHNAITTLNSESAISLFAVTGSGRMLTGSLLRTLFGDENVYIVNEIIAHASGALYYDKSVDTIIEIGGQDSKFIRLSDGIITDFALNEACSAGTGSFLEELCERFAGFNDFHNLSSTALNSSGGVSLGQHCSVFISDVIEKAVASGCGTGAIAVGLFDSIIANYMNRVKKNRPVGKRIFCQGMPFAMDALACAAARYTGREVTIPASPGTVGALGASLLAKKKLTLNKTISLDINSVFSITQSGKDNFICKSNEGCSQKGNRCSIEKVIFQDRQKSNEYYWGGACSLWEKQKKERLPAGFPNPFLERALLVESTKKNLPYHKGGKSIALTDKFHLVELFPFFASFFSRLGFNVVTEDDDYESFLRKGKQNANVTLCSPALMYTGEMHSLSEKNPGYLFNPVFINSLHCFNDKATSACPLIQGSSYFIKNSLTGNTECKTLSPLFRIGRENIHSKEFYESCLAVSQSLGVDNTRMRNAFDSAIRAQEEFASRCLEVGRSALKVCRDSHIPPVIVLGKVYSIHNPWLNSNVPAYLRELGVIPIPMDCIAFENNSSGFSGVYWGYAQSVLNAADHIRKDPGIYSVFCSNYSCGPDSFLESYYNYMMNGKPSLIIENDGDPGNIGTKMRLEIFLHCVSEFRKSSRDNIPPEMSSVFAKARVTLKSIVKTNDKILLPYIGHSSGMVAAALRGSGIGCEALPQPDHEAFAYGKRFTSGKECMPMSVTLGSLLRYIYETPFLQENFKIYYFMPGSEGPCRFGNYSVLDKLIINNLGLQRRVFILSTADNELFDGMPSALDVLIYLAMISIDNLVACTDYVRPVENAKGETDRLFDHYHSLMINKLESINCFDVSDMKLMYEIVSGHLFGFSTLFREVARDLAPLISGRKVKTVSLDGALYVRLDPFSNQNIARKLEEKGLRIKRVPFTEWIDFLNLARESELPSSLKNILKQYLRHRIRTVPTSILHKNAGVPIFPDLRSEIKEISPYIGFDSIGEAVLSVGGSMVQHKKNEVDALLTIGPSECLQCKVADSVTKIMSGENNMISRSVEYNGDPMDQSVIDEFVYDLENSSVWHSEGTK